MTDRRDIRVPKERPLTPAEGAPVQSWHEEPTGVNTDAQVFRAVKALGEEIQANKLEAARAHGALKTELVDLKTSVDGRLTKQDLVLERMAGQLDVLVPMKRSRPSSSETRAIVAEVIETHETTQATKFRRDVVLKVVGGVFSAGVLGALIHWMAS